MAEKHAAVGRIVQIIGPVLDVQFEAGHLPAIYNAIRITSDGYNVPEPIDVTAEVQQHLGEGRVRAVAMEPTEGLVRGMKAVDAGGRSEEHTSELQSYVNLVCRLLLEKKKIVE